MKYKVYLSLEAEDDIFQIYNFILENDGEQIANYVFDQLKISCLNLTTFPDRGHTPPELKRINVFNYKETHYKPYRIIYQVLDNKVYIHCIFDGRRDLQEVLESRLFR
ncbi:MAG: type II toxin-antitoxin system RelE/ParE family toxin [Calditrichales bacterium]|nr:MAG: type II toxin-antitoxin system RelE/ParE family toxin [Calditrichales bacterium]